MSGNKNLFKAFGRTGTEKVAYPVELEWRIENFLALSSAVGEKQVIQWNIPEKNLRFETHLYPGGENENCSGFVSIFTYNESERDLAYKEITGEILGVDGNKDLISFDDKRREFPKDQELGIGWDTFIKRSKIEKHRSKYLRNDALVVFLQFDIEEEMEMSDDNTTEEPNTKIDWAENIKQGFLDGLTDTDITITCEEQEIKCHKFILGLSSNVFSMYFKEANNTLENQTNIIHIKDSDPSSVREFVKFIYTNELREDYNLVQLGQLLHLADKYNIESLKIACERMLASLISVQNVTELAVLGKSYNAEKLKNLAVEFIAKNKKEILESEAWEKVSKKDPKMMMEVMMEVMAKMPAML